MKKLAPLTIVLVLAMLIGIATGCDNRSQLEKDADQAAKDIKSALK